MSRRRTGCGGCLVRLLFLAVLLTGLTGAGLYVALFQPYQGFQNEVFIEIPKGTTTRGIADQLAKAGVIRTSWQFLAAHAIRSGQYLQAGECRFAHSVSACTVY